MSWSGTEVSATDTRVAPHSSSSARSRAYQPIPTKGPVTTDTTTPNPTAADLREQVEAVRASRGSIVAFEYSPHAMYPNDYGPETPTVTHIAISNGETWGITDGSGSSSIQRALRHADFIKALAQPAIVSAVVLVHGEAFKP